MRPRIALQQIVDPRIAQKGAYHDALFVKRNRVDLLLHEDLGGGFSPPAAHKIRRLGPKSREHEVDRTPYKGDRKISFVIYHIPGPSP